MRSGLGKRAQDCDAFLARIQSLGRVARGEKNDAATFVDSAERAGVGLGLRDGPSFLIRGEGLIHIGGHHLAGAQFGKAEGKVAAVFRLAGGLGGDFAAKSDGAPIGIESRGGVHIRRLSRIDAELTHTFVGGGEVALKLGVALGPGAQELELALGFGNDETSRGGRSGEIADAVIEIEQERRG